VTITALILHILCKPFKSDLCAQCETASKSCNAIVLICGIYIESPLVTSGMKALLNVAVALAIVFPLFRFAFNGYRLYILREEDPPLSLIQIDPDSEEARRYRARRTRLHGAQGEYAEDERLEQLRQDLRDPAFQRERQHRGVLRWLGASAAKSVNEHGPTHCAAGGAAGIDVEMTAIVSNPLRQSSDDAIQAAGVGDGKEAHREAHRGHGERLTTQRTAAQLAMHHAPPKRGERQLAEDLDLRDDDLAQFHSKDWESRESATRHLAIDNFQSNMSTIGRLGNASPRGLTTAGRSETTGRDGDARPRLIAEALHLKGESAVPLPQRRVRPAAASPSSPARQAGAPEGTPRRAGPGDGVVEL